MIRISRLTDYGIVLLTHMASDGAADSSNPETHNAKDLASATYLPVPMVSKILKLLARDGLLLSQRGAKGGYRLSKPAGQINVAEVVRALEGPIAITECVVVDEEGMAGCCDNADVCQVRGNWQRINHVVEEALSRISLRDMVQAPCELPAMTSVTMTTESLRSRTERTAASIES
ncbi:SUF system Fe-S cluster assembly regulator [bacterium]|nr:SUF system Fe-S cluster assembly regulator [bacterium]